MTALCYCGCVSQPFIAQITCDGFWELPQVDLHEFLCHRYCLYIYLPLRRTHSWTNIHNKKTQTPPYSRSQHGACHRTTTARHKNMPVLHHSQRETGYKNKENRFHLQRKNKGFQELCMIRLWHDSEMIDIRRGKQKSEILGIS